MTKDEENKIRQEVFITNYNAQTGAKPSDKELLLQEIDSLREQLKEQCEISTSLLFEVEGLHFILKKDK